MQLRDYQEAACVAVLKELATSNSTLVEMATGLGKTVLFAHIAKGWPGRVLVIAHRDELIRQAAEKIARVLDETVAIEMGRESARDELYGCKVCVASVQTLARANRRNRFHPDHFSLLVIDEGHHATAITYREVMEYFGSAKKLFVTATPKRADEVALESVCETVAYQYGIEPAIDDGWLVPVKQSVVKINGLDFSRARTVASDFNQADLERILTEEKPLHAMCAAGHEIIGNRQALWFCASVAHAKATAAVLRRYTDSVEFLSGDSDIVRRREVVAAYKGGSIQHLLNCALFLEGFDAPSTSAIVMGRPTKSLSLYMQVLGRGTRPLPGIVDGLATPAGRRERIAMSAKPRMLVIDFAGNAGKHKIVQAADVLGGKHEPPVRDYAKKTMEEEGAVVDIEEALDRAKEEMDLQAEEDSRRKRLTAAVAYDVHEVSPFVKQHLPRGQRPQRPVVEPCSKGQAGYICHLSRQLGKAWAFEDAKKLSKKQASGVIGKMRRELGQ